MSAGLANLKALALKLGGDAWTADDETGCVFGADGDSVCQCHANAGAMPEFIHPGDYAAFIAAANPAVVLDLIACIEREVIQGAALTAEAVRNKLLDEVDGAISGVLWEFENTIGMHDETYGAEQCQEAVRSLRAVRPTINGGGNGKS